MNEGRTTAIFAAVAAVTLALAFWSKPKAINSDSEEARAMKNQVLFKDFDEPSKAATLQIVKYNEGLGQLDPFEISKDKGGMWKIPSHDDYPADAAEQVRDAATPLIGLKSLDVVTTDRGEHAMYGVLNPDDKDLKVGESGVGMLVRVKDASDKIIADLIIGKADKGRENQRFVRIPSQDAVYVTDLSVTPFTTEFRKWIKGELLGVKSFDITAISLRDYAILPTQSGGYGMRKNFDADLSFDPAKSIWSLDRMLTFENGPEGTALELDAEQELKASSLNDLRTAVQGLEIVNVRRKPKGLAADLKADKSLMENKESLKSLYDQGFFPQEGPNGPEIYATGGETIVGTQDSVQYVLRFGEAVAKLTGENADSEEGEVGGLQRYLLVTAKLDESKFPIPDIQPLPETIEDLKKLEDAQQAAVVAPSVPAAESNPAMEKPVVPTTEPTSEEPAKPEAAAEPTPEPVPESKPETKPETRDETPVAEKPKDEPQSDAPEPKPENELNSCDPQEAPAVQEPAAKATIDSPQAAQSLPGQEPSGQEPAGPPPANQPAAAAAATPQPPAAEKPVETEEELKERLEAARERISKENQQKIDKRNEKIDASRKKVQELNARFSDWYYVVSDSAYKKLKISRDQLIVPKGSSNTPPPSGGAGMPPGFNFPGGLPQGNN